MTYVKQVLQVFAHNSCFLQESWPTFLSSFFIYHKTYIMLLTTHLEVNAPGQIEVSRAEDYTNGFMWIMSFTANESLQRRYKQRHLQNRKLRLRMFK